MVTAVIWAMEGFTQLSHNSAVAAEWSSPVASRMQSGAALVLADKNHDSDAFYGGDQYQWHRPRDST